MVNRIRVAHTHTLVRFVVLLFVLSLGTCMRLLLMCVRVWVFTFFAIAKSTFCLRLLSHKSATLCNWLKCVCVCESFLLFFFLNSLLLSMFSRFVMPMLYTLPYEHICIGPHAQWQCLPLWIFYRNSRSLLSIDIPHHNTVNGISFTHWMSFVVIFDRLLFVLTHLHLYVLHALIYNGQTNRKNTFNARTVSLFTVVDFWCAFDSFIYSSPFLFSFLQFYFWFLCLFLLSDRSQCCLFH